VREMARGDMRMSTTTLKLKWQVRHSSIHEKIAFPSIFGFAKLKNQFSMEIFCALPLEGDRSDIDEERLFV
jgi:hypothetical protein